ncbi:hypothetical protein HYH02_003788 [Chlamydomonas schloesseri]|uniref:FYVE-type domain-containing protein n=1 Tax=Chlamydomonas schloesseri TaxID=2026947 RepID=A0A835WPF1_9CHLO|nr:hypothetical protein HYH02_003788 [Chlamydomonas schloesseri]|eukprot:KAG2451181.1 hypothetical protein HYH02_003788 [Chlamydomonas schloesseri]
MGVGGGSEVEIPQCPVCCETLGRWGGPATLPCGHNGCLECFVQVQQRTASCPLCRASFSKELKLSCNHELEDLIRLATMLFVDESSRRDGWEAFPSTAHTADSYASELRRAHQQANARGRVNASAAATPGGPTGAGAGGAGTAAAAGGFSLGNLALSGLGSLGLSALLGGGGGGAENPNALEDLHDIMTTDPLAAAAAGGADGRRRRHSDGEGDPYGSEYGEAPEYGGDGSAAAATHAQAAQHDGALQGRGVGVAGLEISPSAPYLADSGGAAAQRRGGGGGGGGGGWDPSGSAMSRSLIPGLGGTGSSGGGPAVLSLEPPLWLPDSHAAECLSCHLPFRPFTRLRHHCRLCGKIFCSACAHKRALLPPKYGIRTPQRVCELCWTVLAPHQQLLAGTMAAAAQAPVQDSPDAISLRAWLNSPWTSNLGEDIFKAANLLTTFVKAIHRHPEADLPTAALQGAEGLALLTVARVGAGWSLSFGTGLVVARTQDGGWSAPCAVSAAGMGWGLQLGGQLTDVLLVLRSREALAGLCGGLGAGVVVGGVAALSLGPLGRHADAGVVLNPNNGTSASAYGYSISRGAFVGLSLDSSLLCVRNQINHDFYGYPVTPRQLLLEAAVPQPPAACMLYEGIRALLHRFESRRRLVHSRHSFSSSSSSSAANNNSGGGVSDGFVLVRHRGGGGGGGGGAVAAGDEYGDASAPPQLVAMAHAAPPVLMPSAPSAPSLLSRGGGDAHAAPVLRW